MTKGENLELLFSVNVKLRDKIPNHRIRINIHISERSRPVMTAINDFVMFNFRIIIPVHILITNSCTSVVQSKSPCILQPCTQHCILVNYFLKKQFQSLFQILLFCDSFCSMYYTILEKWRKRHNAFCISSCSVTDPSFWTCLSWPIHATSSFRCCISRSFCSSE